MNNFFVCSKRLEADRRVVQTERHEWNVSALSLLVQWIFFFCPASPSFQSSFITSSSFCWLFITFSFIFWLVPRFSCAGGRRGLQSPPSPLRKYLGVGQHEKMLMFLPVVFFNIFKLWLATDTFCRWLKVHVENVKCRNRRNGNGRKRNESERIVFPVFCFKAAISSIPGAVLAHSRSNDLFCYLFFL